MDRGACQTAVYGVPKELDSTEWLKQQTVPQKTSHCWESLHSKASGEGEHSLAGFGTVHPLVGSAAF